MVKKSLIDPNDRSVITTLRICFGDGCTHAGAGALIGTLISIVLCNRKRWPIVTGLGIGSGYSWANCQCSQPLWKQFADDIAAIVETMKELVTMLDDFIRISERVGLKNKHRHR